MDVEKDGQRPKKSRARFYVPKPGAMFLCLRDSWLGQVVHLLQDESL